MDQADFDDRADQDRAALLLECGLGRHPEGSTRNGPGAHLAGCARQRGYRAVELQNSRFPHFDPSGVDRPVDPLSARADDLGAHDRGALHRKNLAVGSYLDGQTADRPVADLAVSPARLNAAVEVDR